MTHPSLVLITEANLLSENPPLFGPLLDHNQNQVVGFFFELPTDGKIMYSQNAVELKKGRLVIGQTLPPGTYTVNLNNEPTVLTIEFYLSKGTAAKLCYSEAGSPDC